MLTSLDFLNKGEYWPPPCELLRLDLYCKNKELFEGEHAKVYENSFRRIQRVIGNFDDVISYGVIANYQKMISIKTADFLWLEPPKIKAGDADSPEQKAVEMITENSDLHNTGYENTIDISRYGDGLLLIYKEGDHGMIDVTQPSIWFPVVDSVNIKKTLYHVLAWVTEGKKDDKYLNIQIHEKGFYTEKVCELITSCNNSIVKDAIGDTISESVIQTGLDDFAVVQTSNIITSDRCHGMDDYTDVDSIISEILIRVSQISRVLDKHAAPSVQGPAGALEYDEETGQYRLKLGNYFPRNGTDDVPIEYITWDGQLSASFTQLEKLINMLCVISEMGTAIFDTADNTGSAASGTALRLRYMSLLAKVKRVAMRYTPALKKAIKLCSQLGGRGIVNLSDANISITWQDGLPNDDKERADIANIRTGGKATMSQQEAIMYLDDKDEKQAAASMELITADEASSMMYSVSGNTGITTQEAVNKDDVT